MLERTVTGLESCKLQRLLPRTSTQGKRSSHRLRTGFWQHGALAVELSRSWPAIFEEKREKREKKSRKKHADRKPLESDLQASAFTLDFLYPGVQTNKNIRGYSKGKRIAAPRNDKRRPYGTSADGLSEISKNDNDYSQHDNTTASNTSGERPTDAAHGPQTVLHTSFRDYRNSQIRIEDEEASNSRPSTTHDDLDRARHEPSSGEGLSAAPKSEAHDRHQPPLNDLLGDEKITVSFSDANKTELDELLARPDPRGTHHLDVYDTFSRLSPDDRVRYRSRVMVFLSRSRNVVAQSRTEVLIRQISEQEWTDEVLAAIVGFFMRKSQRPVAVKYFKTGATKYGLSGGLGPLLTDMSRKRFWSGALKIWQLWYGAQSEKDLSEPSLDVLEALSVLDKALPGLYFSFEQYLASGLSRELDAKTLESTDPAITAFRHCFAKMALQVAAPARAEVLLAFYRSPRLYHEYLERVTERWLNGEIDRETAGGLGKIYEHYRQMNDFQPSEKLLQGMFEVYYPNRLKELSMLQDDWVRARGELSPTAFNKYLKLHARLGNVAATQELVDRYHLRYPNKDKNKGLLRLMAVHARQGDVQAVQHLSRSISNDSQQHFARAAKRNLLLACVKSGSHEDAVSTFAEMAKNGLPASADYAQMMHMYSKIGDLDGTLRYFSLAQENNVEITTGMVLAVTHAFIGNDRLKDAELVVVEMAERNVTSTEIWNALIKANGEIGNLPRCYGLLSVMKERGIEYLPSTYEALLAGMVRYGQIPAAVALLDDAAKNKTFPLMDGHYAIVMAGAARKGDFGTLAKLAKKAQSLSGHLSFNSQVALLSAAVRDSRSSEKAKAAALQMVQSLSDMEETKRAALSPQNLSSSSPGTPGRTKSATDESAKRPQSAGDIVDVSPSSVRNATAQMGNAVAHLVEMRDDFSIQELVSKYLELGPQNPDEPLPQSLMTSLMRAFYQDGKFRQVLDTWEKYWAQVQRQWVDPESGLVRTNKQYALIHLLRLVTKSLRELGDGEAITQFVVRVQAAGFKFSGDNCNEIVQALAELDHLETAMSWCEIMLMPHWRGWQRFPDHNVRTGETPRFLRAIKRASLDRHFVRPYQQTLLLLYEKHRKLRELASWSPENAALLQAIDQENPRLVTAFAKLPPQFEPRKQIKWRIDKGVSLEQRLDDFVGSMTYEEAIEMQRSLMRLNHSGAMENDSKVWGLLNMEAAKGSSEGERQDILTALTGPFPEEGVANQDKAVSAGTPRVESQVAKMHALEDRARRKFEAERERGDRIIAKRMSDWRARTWRRGRWTRWQDQWAGLGDQRNAPRN